ncbi:MAG: hypothetical protein M3O77_02670, partial [Chloroflexota bacterium]|nr:hypothetical protein [Chloroflexota bacterium]
MTATAVEAAPRRGSGAGRTAIVTPEVTSSLAGGPVRVPAAARPPYLAARRLSLPAATPLVVVARNDDEAHRLADDLAAWLRGVTIRV